MDPEDLTAQELEKVGELDKVKAWLEKDFDRSRDFENQAINELEKVLWLSNSGAATVTIGYLTANEAPSLYQYYGSLAFVSAIVLLLMLKLVTAINASRDRNRRQDHSDKFFTENRPLSYIGEIRDSWYRRFNTAYKTLKYAAIALFVLGCSLTLVGVYPTIETHNNSTQYAPSGPDAQTPRAAGARRYGARDRSQVTQGLASDGQLK